uniref:Uncharacterized protein n=1 Tax=uncultured prokaryote TaxID=198431 RepID=A0A0H5Q5M2_9ZZZZ|nr:hypothetical protein [uncultured prokaryote]
MKQLSFWQPQQHISQPPIVKTPDDTYRAELRLTWHPPSGRKVVAIEVTHENSRELVAWSLYPTDETTQVGLYVQQAWAHLLSLIEELDAPF